MTIRRGEDWGVLGSLESTAPIVDSDGALAEAVAAGLGECGVIGGDLARTVGASGTELELRSRTDRPRLPIDIGKAIIDGDQHLFVAHLVVRGPFWSHVSAVLNSAFLGSWNAAPKAHPNDGRFDLIESELGPADRLKARRRLPSGTHVPHPGIAVRRVTEGELRPRRTASVWIDGRRIGRAGDISYRVEPDAFTIVI